MIVVDTQRKNKEKGNIEMNVSDVQLENRDKFWDILKGIAILSIVLGHSCYFLVRYVYLYHLAIFLFISGYFFNEAKYGDNPFYCFVNKLKSLWPKFLLYETIFVISRNLLIFLNFYDNERLPYGKVEVIQKFFSNVFMRGTETFGSALWFVPMFIFTISIFAGLVWFTRKLVINTKFERYKTSIIVVLSVLIGLCGLILNMKNIMLEYHVQTSLLFVPFYTVGYLLKTYNTEVKKYINLIITLLCLWAMICFTDVLNLRIELSVQMLGNPILFYPISLAGISVCIYIAKMIEKSSLLSNIFSYSGKNSFCIMGLHFFCF